MPEEKLKKKIIKLEKVATKKTRVYKKKKKTAKAKQKKQKTSLMDINLMKNNISYQEFVLIRNAKEMMIEETTNAEQEEPKFYCQNCKMYREGRCVHPKINRPVEGTNRCFRHSEYPQKDEIYLVETNIEIDTTIVAMNMDEIKKCAS